MYKRDGFISELGRSSIFDRNDKKERKVMVERGDNDTRLIDFNVRAQNNKQIIKYLK